MVAKIGGFVDGMSKAERETKRRMDGVEKSVNKAGKAVLGLSAAAATSAAAIVAKVASNAKEIENLSRVANTGAEDFQRIAYAADQFGVQQEKVADILKDVNDKVGDFLTTGAGPMADFFETVAPMVGVTADNFRDLSGKDALQLYVSSLEKANLSQAEMTFFMEAIASDATLLLPLLKNNGKELGVMAKQADTLGAVLSDLEIEQLKEVSRATKVLEGAFSGAANQVSIALLPAMQEMSRLLQDKKTIDGLASIAKGLGEVAKFAVEAATGLANVTKFVGEEIAVSIGGIDPADTVRLNAEIGDLETMLENFRDQLESSNDDDFSLIENLLGAPERIREDLKEQIATVEKELGELYKKRDKFNSVVSDIKAGAGVSTSSISDKAKPALTLVKPTKDQRDAQKALNDEYQKTLENYQRQVDLITATTEREQILYEVQKGRLVGINDEQQKRLIVLAEEIDAQERLKKAASEYADVQKYLSREKTGNPELDSLNEQYDERLEIIKEALAAEAITKQEHDAAMLELDQQTADERKRILEETQAIAQATAINNMANILSITGSQVSQLQSLYGEASGAGKAFYVISQALAAANAVIHGIQAGAAIRVAYAEMAAMSGPGAPGILAAGEIHAQAATALGFASAGMIAGQTIASFEGGGLTWNGPRSGGLDGKGGRLAVMHPNEKIIDLERGGSTGDVNVHMNLPGVTSAKEAKDSSAAISRAVARGVASAQRYR